MASSRQMFVVRLHLFGLGAMVLLGGLVALLLRRAAGPAGMGPTVEGTLLFLAGALLVEVILVRLLVNNILKPTGRAASIATRVAAGDLSVSATEGGPARDLL